MRYRAFGLSIHSDMPLRALIPVVSTRSDITIARGNVPDRLAAPAMVKPYSQSAPGELLFTVPAIARFYVTGGTMIRYQPKANSDPQTIALYLLGTGLGAIMHQRGRLVIHGNALRFSNQAVIFAGSSGQGKSTLAAAFYQKGYELLADDLASVDDRAKVHPSYPQLKLWHDSATRLHIDVERMERVRQPILKYACPLDGGFCDKPLPLKSIYILQAHNENRFEIKPVKGITKMTALIAQTYRFGHLKGLSLQHQHLKSCAQLVKQVEVVELFRPMAGFHIDALRELIEARENQSPRVGQGSAT